MDIKIDASEVLKNLAKDGALMNKIKASVGLYCDSTGKAMQGYAQTNATWKDRTGNARQSIQGGFKWDGDVCNTFVSGNMDYSPYLELAHGKSSQDEGINMEVPPTFAQLELGNEGKYAILRPTCRSYAPKFLSGMNNFLDKIG